MLRPIGGSLAASPLELQYEIIYFPLVSDARADFVLSLSTVSSSDAEALNDNVDLFGPAVLSAEHRPRILEQPTEIGMELKEVPQRRVLAEDRAATAVYTVINGVIDVSAKPLMCEIAAIKSTSAWISRTADPKRLDHHP